LYDYPSSKALDWVPSKITSTSSIPDTDASFTWIDVPLKPSNYDEPYVSSYS